MNRIWIRAVLYGFICSLFFFTAQVMAISDTEGLKEDSKKVQHRLRREMNIEEVTVSAQKMDESAQNVGISMTLFNEFDIEDKRIKSIGDIGAYTPNLMLFSDGNGENFNPTVRGLRTDSGADSSSLGMYIDGIPMLSGDFYSIIMDVERIEILKGPQSTLYGKGTEAGVINIVSKKPDNETKFKIGSEFGSDNKREYFFNISGPVVKDKFYLGLSAKHYEKDGMIKNTYRGGQTDDREYNYGKMNLRYTPDDNVDIFLISQILSRKDGGVSWNPRGAASRENSSDVGESEPETWLNSLKVEYNYDIYKFESITTYKHKKQTGILRDFDFSHIKFYHMSHDNDRKNYSQEFRLSSKTSRFNWLIGLNADRDRVKMDAGTDSINPNYISVSESDYEANSYGAFIHSEYFLTEKFSVLGGLRYDNSDIDFDEKGTDVKESETFDEVSPKLGVKYKLSKGSMIYSTFAAGYKPGGIYTYAAANYPKVYDEEKLWAYEIGSKNSFFNNTLILNAAIYYMKVDDMQVTTFVHESGSGHSFEYKSNAAEATSKGFEFDLTYKATTALKFFAAFGYNDTEFDEYKDAKGDFSGNTNPLAPDYNYNIGAQYRSDSGCYARIDINGYGEMYLDRENQYKRGSFNLVNTKVGYETEVYDIYFYTSNLFDKEYDSDGIYNGAYVIYSEPKEVGVQLSFRF